MANFDLSFPIVCDLEYSNIVTKALEQVSGESFLTYKGLQERDDPDFKGWPYIYETLIAVSNDKRKASVNLELNHILQNMVKDYYKTRYWNPAKLDQITCQHSADEIFTAGVLNGVKNGIKFAQRVVGVEAREQFLEMTGNLPDAVVACVGGGSNAIGIMSSFLNDPVKLYGVEPLGIGTKIGEHAASLTYGTEGIMHGFNSIMLQNEKGEPDPVYSVASGLDYPSVGPEHAYLRDLGRVTYKAVTDDEAIDAFFTLSRLEGIIPALESAHAVAYAMKLAKEMGTGSILVNCSGRGDKDLDFVLENYGDRLGK